MTTTLLDRLTHHYHIVERGNDSYSFQHSSTMAKSRNTVAMIEGKDVLHKQLFDRLIHSCTLKSQRSSLGQISIGANK